MLMCDMKSLLPSNWGINSTEFAEGQLIELHKGSVEYNNVFATIGASFGITSIHRIESPYLYVQFKLRCEEAYVAFPYKCVKELFHDTAQSKIYSIIKTNMDRRYCSRVKYGNGVSFSPYPRYANKQSSRSNGYHRAMIVADVIVKNVQSVIGSQTLPAEGCDTTKSKCGNVYVKYYDHEFYPKYVAFYNNVF